MGRVLVVDDDEVMRRVLRRLVKTCGAEVAEAAGGNEAINSLERESFSLVLTDLQMPNGDGFFLLRAVTTRWPNTPVVMLTGSGDLNDSITALREGATNFLTKPFHQGDLRAIVDHCLEHGGPTRLAGFITERHFEMAEQEFPGITRFYAESVHKPQTFLDLMRQFETR